MIQVYADDTLVYDSRLEEYDLIGLTVTTGLNVGGTASIVMPLGHPAYNAFTSYKTIVKVYRDGVLRFRGRALYPADTFYGQRTITCEGEMCFFRDSIRTPGYIAAALGAPYLRGVLSRHNEQVEEFKRFKVGEVTVQDDYVRLELETAETTLASLNKLLERCGGYFVFSDDADGSRVINWYASLEGRSDQVIEFGENLLDFTRTGANTTALATGIIPYGAQTDSKNNIRVTIASVNGGNNYILAEDAIAVRGTIMTTVTWDDVTEPENLLKKARAYLDEHKNFITSLELTALDLSYLDKDIASFSVGDLIRVISKPHGLDEFFQLTTMTEDYLNPAQSRITLGKDVVSLTGADVAGDFKSQTALDSTKTEIKKELTATEEGLATQVEESVMQKVGEEYVKRAETEGFATKSDLELLATAAALTAEVNARAGIINKVNGVVNISGGAPVKILGGKVEIDGSEIHLGKEARFLNGSGIRIADKDGNFYYVLRVDGENSCVAGNDYTNLYLRGKDAVYLYKTGATVTSDRREKNSIEELPASYEALLDKLTPLRFKYNGKGDRYHVGFVAQEVDEALTAAGLTRDDFGGFVDLKGDGSELGLAYDEFIGLLLQKQRKLEKRLKALEDKQ